MARKISSTGRDNGEEVMEGTVSSKSGLGGAVEQQTEFLRRQILKGRSGRRKTSPAISIIKKDPRRRPTEPVYV